MRAPEKSPAPTDAPGARRPRSVWPARLGWAVAFLLLGGGLPFFLCMPPWVDITHYDLCARTVLHGGVHYRDSFDTNLPGMVWLHMAIRSVAGWRSETLRAADLLVLSGVLWLLLSWLRLQGQTAGARAWAAVALIGFYLTTGEICHCQRDLWMLLPTLAALRLRYRQLAVLAGGPARPRRVVLAALAEGLCWGAGIWIKPFVAVPALACWLVGLLQLRRAGIKARGLVLQDLSGLLAGGMIAGIAGLVWLWESGSWATFWDIFLHWNPEYREALYELRRGQLLRWVRLYLPWSFVPVPAAMVAFAVLYQMLLARPVPGDLRLALNPRPLLAAFFLGWVVQALLLQFPHDYVLAPTILLAVVVLAGLCPAQPRRGAPGVAFALLILLAIAWHVFAVWPPERFAQWPRCWYEGSTDGLRDDLSLETTPERTDWEELARVAEYLRERGVKDRELLCFNTSPSVLYLQLNVVPATRFFQPDTMLQGFWKFDERLKTIKKELEESRPRYVVSDLQEVIDYRVVRKMPYTQEPVLPPEFPVSKRDEYPWNTPVVFRSGRYVVHDPGAEVNERVLEGKTRAPSPR